MLPNNLQFGSGQAIESNTDICHSQQRVVVISWCWCLLQLHSRRILFPLQGYSFRSSTCSSEFEEVDQLSLSVAALMSGQDVQVTQCWGVICWCALKDDVPVKSREEKGENLTARPGSLNQTQRKNEWFISSVGRGWFVCCVSHPPLPPILFPGISEAVLSIKPYKGQKINT